MWIVPETEDETEVMPIFARNHLEEAHRPSAAIHAGRQRARRAVWPALVMLLMALAALACNLSSPPASPTPFPIVLTTATPFTLPSATPRVSTATPFPTIARAPAGPPCTPNTTWPLYTVVGGDILSSIATRSGTTIAALVEANCLANPNLISVGQRLRVPRIPDPPSATPPTAATVPPGTPVIGPLTISPAIQRGDGAFLIDVGTVNVIATGVTGAVRVTFYVANAGLSPTILGIDDNLLDGASVPWTNTTTSISAQLWAVASSATGLNAQTLPILALYVSTAAPTVTDLVISPRVEVTGRPEAAGLRPGLVTLTATGVANATRVQFFFASLAAGSTPELIGETTTINAGSAAIVWSVTGPTPTRVEGVVWARVTNSAGQAAQTASIPVVFLP